MKNIAKDTKSILVVEDDYSLMNVLRKKLISVGFNVFEAANGEEGLDAVSKHRPDLILLDIIMPKMDGLTMLKKLREDEWGKKAKVILLTNLSDEEKVLKENDLGSFDYLVKSDWSLEDIVRKIRKKLNIK